MNETIWFDKLLFDGYFGCIAMEDINDYIREQCFAEWLMDYGFLDYVTPYMCNGCNNRTLGVHYWLGKHLCIDCYNKRFNEDTGDGGE